MTPARIKRALTSSGVNPTWGLMIVVAARITAVISALRIVDHLFLFKTQKIAPNENLSDTVQHDTPVYVQWQPSGVVWNTYDITDPPQTPILQRF